MELTIEQTLQQAIAAHKEGKLQEAERLYRTILQSQPLHPDANHNLGLLAVSVNKADAALPLFKTALEANPKIEQFWLSYIDALFKEKQFENAKLVIEQAKTQGVAKEKLNSLEAQLSPKTQIENVNSTSPSQQQLSNLLEHYQAGRLDDAEKLATSISQDFPKHQIAWKVLGAIFGQSGRTVEAENAYQTVVVLNPQDPEAHNNLGGTLQQMGRLDEAQVSYKQAIALKPDYAEAYNNVGGALKELRRLDEAEASLVQAIALKPDFADAHYNLGNILQELGRLDEAEASLTQAIALKPDYVDAHNNLGITLQKLGRLDEAQASYTQAISLKPDYAEAHDNLGSTLQELGRLDEAEASYAQAIALEPGFVKAYDHLGSLLQNLDKFKDAEMCYKKYISLDPNTIPVTKSMASRFFSQGEFQKSLSLFDSYNTTYSRTDALKCLYALGNTKEIYKRIEDTAGLDDGNLHLAAFSSFIAESQKKVTAHRFCKKPLEFLHFTNLSSKIENSNSFITDLIKDLDNVLSEWQPPNQSAVGGFQTTGNLFRYSNSNILTLKEIILNEIDLYYEKFQNENCSFMEKWPNEKNIIGWHMRLKEQGYHNFHIHPSGWLSGVIYLKVVPSLNKNEGAIKFNLTGPNISDSNLPEIIHNPAVGDMILFPSSLYHGTIPFSTDTDRIVVSFDLNPSLKFVKS